MAEAVLESTVKAATEAIGRPDCNTIQQAIMDLAVEQGFRIRNLGVTFANETFHVTCEVTSYTSIVEIQNVVSALLVGTQISQSNNIQVR